MCLIAFSIDTHPTYKVVIAANRDEFYNRATRKAGFWKDENLPHVLAGKDLVAGGTWMGITKEGKWGALTNFRDPEHIKTDAPSRGDLVLNYLTEDISAQHHIEKVRASSKEYNGFNLLLGDMNGVFHYSNQHDLITELDSGIHGVSNALLDSSWPKLDAAKSNLEATLKTSDFTKEELFSILKNGNRAEDNNLPNTGVPYEWEKALSSIFIKTENYGTLCSTLLLIDHDGNAEFLERRYDNQTSEIIEENTFKLVFS